MIFTQASKDEISSLLEHEKEIHNKDKSRFENLIEQLEFQINTIKQEHQQGLSQLLESHKLQIIKLNKDMEEMSTSLKLQFNKEKEEVTKRLEQQISSLEKNNELLQQENQKDITKYQTYTHSVSTVLLKLKQFTMVYCVSSTTR